MLRCEWDQDKRRTSRFQGNSEIFLTRFARPHDRSVRLEQWRESSPRKLGGHRFYPINTAPRPQFFVQRIYCVRHEGRKLSWPARSPPSAFSTRTAISWRASCPRAGHDELEDFVGKALLKSNVATALSHDNPPIPLKCLYDSGIREGWDFAQRTSSRISTSLPGGRSSSWGSR